MTDPVRMAEQLSQSSVFQNMPPPLQTALFLGAMTLIPMALVTLTSYTRIIIVMSFVRRAVTQQDIPPNSVLIGLALFLTLFVMGPTFDIIGRDALTPYLDGKIPGAEAVARGTEALRGFMIRQTRKTDLALFIHLSRSGPIEQPRDVPLRVLMPAFVISELKTAFIMGFCLFLPFLLVDLIVASVLTSMGMVMMPPVIISAPFKVLLFVVADGWHMVTRALSLSFG